MPNEPKRCQGWSKLLGLALAAAITLEAAPVLAGGLARPNPISARSVGFGGAFSAIADDPTALHFNPAGLARLRKSHVMIGAEFVVAPRTYEPDLPQCEGAPELPVCQSQSPTSPVRPLPSLGFATRLKNEGAPSRIALGIGVWNSFGGQLLYQDKEEIPGTLQETRNAVIEIVPGIAYEVNDILSIGAALRIGYGLFDSVANERPNDAEMSATGLGAGGSLGILVTPSRQLSIGAYYRSALTVTTTGSGQILPASGSAIPVNVEFKQKWPQQAGFSVAFKPIDKLTLAGQLDWHAWSRVNTVEPVFAGENALTAQARIQTDWDNNYALHAGIEYELSESLALRGGYTFDSTAVTERLRERQFLDGDSMLFAVGSSYYISKSWRVDSAFELGPGGTSTIENNSMEVSAWPQRANVSPGDHSGKLYTFELAFQYLY